MRGQFLMVVNQTITIINPNYHRQEVASIAQVDYTEWHQERVPYSASYQPILYMTQSPSIETHAHTFPV